jgi:hypothetical protein
VPDCNVVVEIVTAEVVGLFLADSFKELAWAVGNEHPEETMRTY